MKVFLSWSGKISHEVALVFKDWLPQVIQTVEPYVSSEDIEKGSRWSGEIEKALRDSGFGIICLTKDNLTAPWLNFEAGALSKVIKDSSAHVCPFLFGLERSVVQGPLVQFQSVTNDEKEVRRLIKTLFDVAKEENDKLQFAVTEKSFERFWPDLERALHKIEETHRSSSPPPKRTTEDVLNEILELTRNQSRQAALREDVAAVASTILSRIELGERSRNPFLYSGGMMDLKTGLGMPINSPYILGGDNVTLAACGASLGT
jgi:hypothetical protein